MAHSDSAVSEEDFPVDRSRRYQQVEPLQIGELWALPSLLALRPDREFAPPVGSYWSARAKCGLLANRSGRQEFAATPDGNDVAVLERHTASAGDPTFATQLLHRLRNGSYFSSQALAWLENALESVGLDAEEAILTEHAILSGGQPDDQATSSRACGSSTTSTGPNGSSR